MTGHDRVIVYVRQGCSLCGPAIQVVERVCADLQVAWREVDVDQDQALTAQYGDYVPAVTVDGVVQGFWRIDEQRLRLAVRTGVPR